MSKKRRVRRVSGDLVECDLCGEWYENELEGREE
jgi:hypothetical protein